MFPIKKDVFHACLFNASYSIFWVNFSRWDLASSAVMTIFIHRYHSELTSVENVFLAGPPCSPKLPQNACCPDDIKLSLQWVINSKRVFIPCVVCLITIAFYVNFRIFIVKLLCEEWMNRVYQMSVKSAYYISRLPFRRRILNYWCL
jgi:hypothetical protein